MVEKHIILLQNSIIRKVLKSVCVGLGNTKLITFFDEYNNVDVSISPLNSIITYKEI
jgi:hypothetical protein|nr:MAG TPA: hypothetical protein [Bacteriophage sp.]